MSSGPGRPPPSPAPAPARERQQPDQPQRGSAAQPQPSSGSAVRRQSPSGQSCGSRSTPVSSRSHVSTGYGTPYTLSPAPQGRTPRDVTPARRNSPLARRTNAGPPESPPHASRPSPPARNSRPDGEKLSIGVVMIRLLPTSSVVSSWSSSGSTVVPKPITKISLPTYIASSHSSWVVKTGTMSIPNTSCPRIT